MSHFEQVHLARRFGASNLVKTPFYIRFAADLRSSLGRIVCSLMSAALVATACLSQTVTDQTQTPSLLLPQLMHVRGQVVGETGEPIPKVRLNHLNPSDDIVTNSNGEFDFNTLAPRFVAQRPGFQSALVQTSESARLQLVLHKSPSGSSFPVCSDPKLSDRAPGWGGVFQVPRSQASKAGREVLDVDYWARAVRVKSTSKALEVVQGRGPMWGGDGPDDRSVWRSIRYTETTYDLDGHLLTDAKGWFANGKCWRTVGIFSESVSYSNVDCELTRPLDDLLDGICVITHATKRLTP